MKPISRTLAIWLGTIIILSGILVGMIYAVTLVSRHRAAYLEDVRSRADFIAKELSIDLWSYNEASIAHIAQTAINFAGVRAIQILDDGGKLLFAAGDPSARETMLCQEKIHYHGRPVGELKLTFAPFDPATVWRPILATTLTILLPVLLASVLMTFLLLKFCLSNPLKDLIGGIRSISEGCYETRIAVRGGWELDIIAGSVNLLSEKLSQRESALKEKEARLRESVEKYRVLFNAFPMGITVTDPNGNILETNAQVEAMLGISKAKYEGRSILEEEWQIIGCKGMDSSRDACAGVTALRENRRIENREQGYVRPDGRVVWLNVTAAPIPLERHGVVIAYGDVTERKRLEKDLHAYRNIVSSTDDFISLIDADYVYRIVNDSYLRLNCTTREEIIGHPVVDIQGEDHFNSKIKHRLDQCLAGEIVRFQSWFEYAGAGRRFMDITYSPYRENGEIRGITVNGRDITDLKQAEERLKELNATLEGRVSERSALAERRTRQLRELALELSLAEDRERRRLAATLHDDLQQHLAYIKVRARLAATPPEGGIDAITRHELQEIEVLVQESIDKCRSLCYELTPPELYREGLLPALEGVVEDFRERYGLDVAFTADPESEPDSSILCLMIFRSVKELLNNTVKHSGAMGAVVELACDGDQIRVRVADPGNGCDLAEVGARRGSGAGFGLFNISDRMEFIGGQVEFRSAVSEGFSASMKVPKRIDDHGAGLERGHPHDIHLRDASPKSAPHAAAGDAGDPIRILIADDHDLIRAGLVKLFQGHPDLMVVGEASNGVEAVRLAAETNPHVVLMDVSMPQMDGIEASADIRRAFPDIRIIGISMNTDGATRRRMLRAGASAFLSKSGSFEALIREIRQTRQYVRCID